MEARSSLTGYPQTKDSGSQESCVPFCQDSSDSNAWSWELGPSFDAKRHCEIFYWRRGYTLVGCSILELDFTTQQIQLQEMGFEEGLITQVLCTHG